MAESLPPSANRNLPVTSEILPPRRPPVFQEGVVSSVYLELEKKSKKLKRWQKYNFSVDVGTNESTITKHKRTTKTVHTFATGNPQVEFEMLSNNPRHKNYLVFNLNDATTGMKIATFRAKDFVHLRKLKAALGMSGEGVFTKKIEGADAVPVEATHRLWNVIHPSEDELVQRQDLFDKKVETAEEDPVIPVQPSVDQPPTYADTMHQLPLDFYFPTDTGIKPPPEVALNKSFPGAPIPLYDASQPLPEAYRRPFHDIFRPPHGPPIFYPVSLGYGQEVGLQVGQQALWDPVSKSFFFLDHINQLTFYDDPRSPKPHKPKIEKGQQFVYGDCRREGGLPQNMCNEPAILKETAKRARDKKHGFVVHACGRNGVHGSHGHTGHHGSSGELGVYTGCGCRGGDGSDGTPGGPGTTANSGTFATTASDVILNVWGSPEALNVSGSSNLSFTANLGGVQNKEVLFVNCRGGDGGHGGRGGDGGCGGGGGRGSFGGIGMNGMYSPTGNGGDGGDGGDGGKGGNGGNGGPAGNGGSGGNAGFGGACVIQSPDPRLLILVEADCRAGHPGSGGSGGTGGSGGDAGEGGGGGCGGSGGIGGGYTDYNGHYHVCSSGSPGLWGKNGSSGRSGFSGASGTSGADGQPANDGSILWVVSAPNGGVLYQSSTRYNLTLESLEIHSAVDDGIFEPNEQILVTGVTVTNNGGLPLPAGTLVYMKSSKTIKFPPFNYELPDILPEQKFVIPTAFYGRIFDQPPPNATGAFVSKASFKTRMNLLGRPFEDTRQKRQVVVQYPVKLAYLKCEESLGRREVGKLIIGIENISTLPYGACDGTGGRVSLQIHMDARILPVGAATVGFAVAPYTVTFDPNIRDSLYVQLQQIAPGQTVEVEIIVQMESRAELLDRCYWQADLYLRDKLIQYEYQKIRVSPFYTPTDPPADVLMVTHQGIGLWEFVFWQKILEILGVNVAFWDVDRYKGFSVDTATSQQHPVTWKGAFTGRTIIYPYCDLSQFYPNDIVEFFHGSEATPPPKIDLNSGLVLFMPTDVSSDKEVLSHLASISEQIEIPDEKYSAFHRKKLCSSDIPYFGWEEKRLKKLEKENQRFAPVVYQRRTQFSSLGSFKFGYGSVDIRRLPLLRSCKLLVVGGGTADMKEDDPGLSTKARDVPIGSNFAQVYLVILSGLSLLYKMNLLKISPEESEDSKVSLYLPTGRKLTKADIAMCCIASEIADEVYSCTGLAYRMIDFAKDVSDNLQAYISVGGVVLQGVDLIQRELDERKQRVKHSKVKSSIDRTTALCTTVRATLMQSGVDGSNLEGLPRLDLLLNKERVFQSNKYIVKDDHWDTIAPQLLSQRYSNNYY